MTVNQIAIEELLRPAGIEINGRRPFDIQINDDRFYERVLRSGSIGLGESYMEGLWDCEALDQFFFRLLNTDVEKDVRQNIRVLWYQLKVRMFNQQTRSKSHEVAKKHYDIGNEIYEHMLDKYMMYSCAYWEHAETLDEAQEHKLELICQKLKLRPGLHVLDIGCGWGVFAQYAAEKYQVKVTGITISKEQAKLAEERCKDLSVEIRLQDYRDIDGKFDRIVSIGMLEHVGFKNYRRYMEIAQRNLKTDGIFLLHCIGGNETAVSTDPWINKHIFPNGLIPSVVQISKAVEDCLILEDWHNFGLDYDRTLMVWLSKFKGFWPKIEGNYTREFYRMWEYYLSVSAASFRARKNHLWQIVFTKRENLKGYRSVRLTNVNSKNHIRQTNTSNYMNGNNITTSELV